MEVALEAVERVAAVLEGTERVEPEAVVAVERAALRDGAAAGGVKGTAAEVMLVVARQALATLGLVAVEAVAKAAVATVVQVGVAVARMVEGVVEGGTTVAASEVAPAERETEEEMAVVMEAEGEARVELVLRARGHGQ